MSAILARYQGLFSFKCSVSNKDKKDVHSGGQKTITLDAILSHTLDLSRSNRSFWEKAKKKTCVQCHIKRIALLCFFLGKRPLFQYVVI